MDSNRGIGTPAARYAVVPVGVLDEPALQGIELDPHDPEFHTWIPDYVSPSVVGYMENNVPLAAVQDAETGSPWLAAIKGSTNGGPLELFGSEVARAANMGRLVEHAHRLPNGDAAIPFVHGDTAGNVGITDGHALVESITAFHSRTMSDAAAGARALDDMARMVAFDATIGMFDRSWRNVMIQPDGDMRLIDHASLTDGSKPSAHVGVDGIPTTSLFHAYVENGPLPIERVGQHWELPVSAEIAADFGMISRERLQPAFDLARADALASARPGYVATHVPESLLDDVLERAAWISEHARVPFTFTYLR